MTELKNQSYEPTKIINHQEVQAPIPRQNKIIGSIRMQRGHKLWQYNVESNTLQECDYKLVTASYADMQIRRQVKFDSDCIYIQALNKINAIRKIAKIYAQIKTEPTTD